MDKIEQVHWGWEQKPAGEWAYAVGLLMELFPTTDNSVVDAAEALAAVEMEIC